MLRQLKSQSHSAGEMTDADFVGFAYGDVNSLGRSSAALDVEDAPLEAGQTHSVVISGPELAGFQGAMELAAGLELVDVAFEGEVGSSALSTVNH